jgi:hypothetical protein
MLLQRTQPTSLHKVKAHTNIIGNEIADALAKRGRKQRHYYPSLPHEFSHSTPYYLHKDEWIGMYHTPYKGPIHNFQRYLHKYTTDTYLTELAHNFHNIQKWTNDANIDKISSNSFWQNPQISEAQIKQLIKFRTNQYMGNARKHLFWPLCFPNIHCPLCNTIAIDTWPHLLLACPQPHIHALRTKRHNKAIWEIRKLILSSPLSRCLTLMNAGIYNSLPPENTVPPWLLPYICLTSRYNCNAKYKPDILCVQGLPHLSPPPLTINPSLTIQFIEFTYTNDRYLEDKINTKINKYQPLIDDIKLRGWNIKPLIVILAGARGTTHIPSLKVLKEDYKYKDTIITHTLTNINSIAIHHLTSILLHKRRLEHNQPLPTNQDPS